MPPADADARRGEERMGIDGAAADFLLFLAASMARVVGDDAMADECSCLLLLGMMSNGGSKRGLIGSNI